MKLIQILLYIYSLSSKVNYSTKFSVLLKESVYKSALGHMAKHVIMTASHLVTLSACSVLPYLKFNSRINHEIL